MVTAAQAYWLNRRRRRARNEGVGGAQIVLSNSYISELSSNPTAVGTLSVVGGTGVWTFSELLDADNKFGVTGSTLNKTASVAYDTKSSHVVTIRATNGTDTIDRVMTIFVMTVPAQIGSGDWSVADLGTNGDALITISVAPDTRNSAITAYQYQVGAGAWTTLGSTIGPYPISGLTDGSAVNIGVRAVNAIGNGTGSAAKSVTSTGIPAAFVDADWSIAGANNKGTVTVASNPANNGSSITAIQYSKDGGAWTNSGISGPGSFDVSGTNGVLMSVRLRAVNANGNGPDGNAETATPSAVVTIDAPTSVTWVADSNPPQFNMLSPWATANPVLVGDIPYCQFDGTGTIYVGSAVAAPNADPMDFSAASPAIPTLTAGLHSVRHWYGRTGVTGDKSTALDFTVSAGALPVPVYRAAGNAPLTGATQTITGLDVSGETGDFELYVGSTCLGYDFTGADMAAPTFTPNGSSPISGALHGQSKVYNGTVAFMQFHIPAGTPGINNGTVSIPYAGDPFEKTRVTCWTCPTADLNSTTPTDFDTSGGLATSATVGLTTSADGAIMAVGLSGSTAGSDVWSGDEAGITGAGNGTTTVNGASHSSMQVSGVGTGTNDNDVNITGPGPTTRIAALSIR